MSFMQFAMDIYDFPIFCFVSTASIGAYYAFRIAISKGRRFSLGERFSSLAFAIMWTIMAFYILRKYSCI